MYLRMISKKAKWEQSKKLNIDELSSDIITNCLRTKEETLSLWYIDDMNKVDDALIALASNRDLVQKLDYIIIPDKYIEKYNLELKKANGNSPYEAFNKQHWNIINLTYTKLGAVSKMILELITTEGNSIIRVYEDEILKKLSMAIKEGKIKKDNLKDTLQKEIA